MQVSVSIRRRGFSLIDLLVVAFIIGLLISLLLPAVQKVRYAAARAQSMNNMKQLALGCLNYESANAVFPPGVDANHYSTACYLLPYIEQGNLFNQIDFKKDLEDKANDKIRGVLIKTFLNPNDNTASVKDGFGPTNYLFNAGSRADLRDNNGICYADSKVKINSITDGTSNTLLLVETLKGKETPPKSVKQQHVLLKKEALKELKPEAGVEDWNNDKNLVADRCRSWLDGRFLQGTFTGTRVLNDEKPDVNCEGGGGWSGVRSFLDQGIIGMVDGSVRSVSKGVTGKTWNDLSSRDDGNVLGKDFNE